MKTIQIQVKNRRLDTLTWYAKNLYNQANYLVRQEFIRSSKLKSEGLIKTAIWLRWDQLDKCLHDEKNYKILGSNASQEVLRLLEQNWKSYFKSIKSWNSTPSKFLSKPNMPNYKNKETGRFVLTYACANVRYNSGFLILPKTKIKIPCSIPKNKLKVIRIIPKNDYQIIEIVHTDEEEPLSLDHKRILSIDLGLDNLITSIDSDGISEIISGKQIKSINQFYNKQKAKFQSILEILQKRKWSKRLNSITRSRNNRIKTLLHDVSKFLVSKCIDKNIGTIIIGYNPTWKQEINIGKKNNQNFVNIPFKTLIEQIQYKATLKGINVQLTEESYTSKCDSLSLEEVGKHEVYLGKRIKRGLFQSHTKKLINADVNGSINILRKVNNDSVAKQIIDKGFCFNPIKYRNIFNLNLSDNSV